MFGIFRKTRLKTPLDPIRDIESHWMDGATLNIDRDPIGIRVTSPMAGVIRLRIAKDGFEPDYSYAVVDQEISPKVNVVDHDDRIEYKSDCATLVLHKKPFRVEFLDGEGAVYTSQKKGAIGFCGNSPAVTMSAPAGEMYLGLGEKTGGLNKRGKRWTMRNSDMPYRPATDPLYQSIPMLIGLRKGRAWGAFFDNTFLSEFDLSVTNPDSWTWWAEEGELNVYFIAGPTLPDVTRRYMRLVGGIPMPPLWSLGYHQSRYSYKTEGEVRKVAKSLRDLEIPCDAIHLDIHYMRGYRVFTFDKSRFPDPKGLADDMAARGIKLVCIVDPGVKEDPDWDVWNDAIRNRVFCKSTKGGIVVKYCWPLRAGWPDFGREEVRRWWGEQHRAYTEAGIAGIWNDMNEPSMWNHAFYLTDMVVPTSVYDGWDMVHTHAGRPSTHKRCRNVYGMLEDKAARDGLLRLKPNTRPLVITRSGYAGVGRYAIMWTGDNWSTWAHLRLTLPMLINLGLTGQPMCGPDTGGFIGNASRELFARWIQIASLYPFCRGHTMVRSLRHEPYKFGKRVENISRNFLGLRYRMLPYLYSLTWQAHRDGDPLWRPLSYHFQDDERAAGIEDQVMVGPFLMAAPVMEKKARARSVYLPAGKWFDYFTGTTYEGPGRFDVEAPLENMPLFVREGAVIPMGPLMQHTGEKQIDPLTLLVYPGEGNFTLTEDDGESMEYEKGMFSETPLSVTRSVDSTLVTIGQRRGKFPVADRNVIVRVRTESRTSGVTINGRSLSPDEWNHRDGFVEVEFNHTGEETVVQFS